MGKDIEAIVAEWIEYLQTERLWGPDDPLFPATKVKLGQNGYFENGGLDRRRWKDAAAIRKIFREAFERAGLPYFNPHSLRKTLASLGERICPNAEALKAWSQNLGHAHVLTTLTSYGAVTQYRQDEILSQLTGVADRQVARDPAPSRVLVESDALERIEKLLVAAYPRAL